MQSHYSSAGGAVMAGASLRAATLLLFLSLIAAPSAFGQMGSSAVYSDMWVDDSAAPAEYVEGAAPPPYTVVATGVTQDNYNSYGHTYWVMTTLRSPNGRTASVTSYKTNAYSAYTRGDASLSYDPTDLRRVHREHDAQDVLPLHGREPLHGVQLLRQQLHQPERNYRGLNRLLRPTEF